MKLKGWLLALAGLMSAAQSHAQAGKTPWEELGNRLKASEQVSALGPNLFGDQVSLSNGALSFVVTDVSIPGNNALPVAFTRKYQVRDWRYRLTDGMLEDWDVELPHISVVDIGPWLDSDGGQSRCSVGGPAPSEQQGLAFFDYWHGPNLYIPGITSGELLTTADDTQKPSSAHTMMTNDLVHVSCLTSIKNGAGQGFLAIAPDGTKYWFDWMAQHAEPVLKTVHPVYTPGGADFIRYHGRFRNTLYVTRVEDRFGNYVIYSYANDADEPGKLKQITSSDGRTINVNYADSTPEHDDPILSVSDGVRAWSYTYGPTGFSGRRTLTSVTQPDAAVWSINLAAFTNAQIETLEYIPFAEVVRKRCDELELPQNYDLRPLGTITHPSGAVGRFELYIEEHGRSNVPLNCRNVTTTLGSSDLGSGNDTNDDTPLYPTSYYAFTLSKKSIGGPGLEDAVWTYGYAATLSTEKKAGVTVKYPVCTLGFHECMAPTCTDDSCAGSSVTLVVDPDGNWVSHRYGNSYRYNEGKLMSVVVGSGPTTSAPLRKTTHFYDLSMTDNAAYRATWGVGQRAYGDSFQSEYHRPLVKTVTTQDDASFVWEVETGCTPGAIYCLDRFARPIRVKRSGTVSTASTGDNPVIVPAAAPVLTVPATNSTGSFSLSWSAVHLADSYELQEQLGSGTWSEIYEGAGASKSVTGRTTGSWNYQVRACNVVGCGAWSATDTTLVTLPPATAPTLTAPAANNTGNYTVSWTAISTATRYELQQRIDGGAWSEIQDAATTSRAMSAQPSATYGYQVRACNTGGCGPFSAVATTVVSLSSLGDPSLTAPTSVVADTTFTVSWTTIAGATSYTLERNRDGGAWTVIYTGAATSKSEHLAMPGDYRYRVKACNAEGCGATSSQRMVRVEMGDYPQMAPGEPDPAAAELEDQALAEEGAETEAAEGEPQDGGE